MSDISMNLAQQLLKEQFPTINGLQSTLLQSRKGVSTEQLQIIHSRGDHWIVASTVGSKGDKVQVCDSMYSTPDKTTLDEIASLFYSQNDGASKAGRRKTVRYMPSLMPLQLHVDLML